MIRLTNHLLIRVHLAALLAVVVAVGSATAQATTPTASHLRRRVTLAWQEQELGVALTRLSETQRLPLWVDRRVDISATVNLTANNQTVAEVLDALAAEQQLAAVVFRGVVYFGPQQTAAALPQLASQTRAIVATLSPTLRAKWLAAAAWKCPRLSQPRQLIERLLDDAGAKLENGDRIPHDVWPAKSLPAMPAVDGLVLLLAGFDLTCEIAADGRRVSLAPIDFASVRPTGPQQLARQKIQKKEAKERPQTAGDQAFTLTLANQPVGAVIDQLAKQLDLQVEWRIGDVTTVEEIRKTLTSCDVREVGVDELLDAVLTPAGLQADHDEKTLTIRHLGAPPDAE